MGGSPLKSILGWRVVPKSGGGITMRETNLLRLLGKKPKARNGVKSMCVHCVGCIQTSRSSGLSRLIRKCSSKGCSPSEFCPYQANPFLINDLEAVSEKAKQKTARTRLSPFDNGLYGHAAAP